MTKESKFFELLAAQAAAGKTTKDSAAAIGCSASQAYRIGSSPGFRSRVGEIRSAAIDAATGEITSACVLAVRRLVELLDDPHNALGAAKAILVHVAPMSDLGELRHRMDRLEQAQHSELRLAR